MGSALYDIFARVGFNQESHPFAALTRLIFDTSPTCKCHTRALPMK